MTKLLISALLIVVSFSLSLNAQDKPKEPPKPKSTALIPAPVKPPDKPALPVISPDLRAKFWRAQLESTNAQAQADKTRQALEKVIGDMIAACVPNKLVAGDDGEPKCVEDKSASTPPVK